jgi:hypothetical protein
MISDADVDSKAIATASGGVHAGRNAVLSSCLSGVVIVSIVAFPGSHISANFSST